MSKFEKIRALRLERRKGFRVLVAVELLALLLGVIGLFGKEAVFVYHAAEMPGYFGSYAEDQEGIVANETDGTAGNLVDFVGISLPRGTYRVQLAYVTDTDGLNECTVEDKGLGEGLVRSNGAHLFSGLDHTDFDMWLLRDSREMVVHADYSGTGMLAVQDLTIRQTNAWNRMILFLLFCICTVINVVYCYIQYDRVYEISAKNKNITFGLGVIILLASLPLTMDYMVGSGDLVYHLMRVEGIKDGILNGQFPIRISPEWQQGYGYASPIFYGETFLYLAAMFRLIGFSVTTSYRIFMFVVTVATVLIAYHCFKRIFEEAYVGLFCSALYSLCVYRIYRTHITGSWGECFGIMLLPLILYSFWRIFTQDVHKKSYRRSWMPLTIGSALLFQSHLLSCEMVGVFTILLCVWQWRKVFRRQTLLVLVKAAVFSVLLSAWFMIPFLDYMLTGDFVIHHVSGRTIQSRGLLVAHLFLTFFEDGGNVFYDTAGMANSAATGVGISLVAALVILAALLFTGRIKALKEEEQKLGVIAGVLSSAAMVMSLNLFPWDQIQALNGVAASLVSSLQTPARWLIIPSVGLTVVAGVVMKYMMGCSKAGAAKIYVAGMLFLLTLSSVYLQEGVLNTAEPVRVYNSEGMGTGYISGAEYLPYGAAADQFMYHDPYTMGDLQVADHKKLSLGADAYVANLGDRAGRITFPLLYYKGYRAYGKAGEWLNCIAGDNFQVTVEIPAGYEGEIRVRFVSPWYWRVGEGITCVTVLALLFLFLKDRKRIGG
ncbi:MAG: hypothetical protein J1E64_03615 [Acetatifactor sp.]|nr:hypothetical protein [Acetatifactor sp.]